jgi:hypothetical protein
MARQSFSLSVPPAWFQVARYVGHRDVRAWIRCVVEDALESPPLRFVPITPLEWHCETFKVNRTADGTAYALLDVRGLVSGPFGIYRGCYLIQEDPKRVKGFTLAHVPTGRRLAFLPTMKRCELLAEELAPLRMSWHVADRVRARAEDAAKAADLIRDHERAAEPKRAAGHAGVGRRRR